MIDSPDAEASRIKQIRFLAKLMEVNQYAFAAQEERGALLREISALEEKLASFEAWSTEQGRYELKDDELSYRVPPRPNGDTPISVWRRSR